MKYYKKETKNVMQYDFYRRKYGEELLIDVVELRWIRKFLSGEAVHCLGYYDVTLITEGKGVFSVGANSGMVKRGDVVFSRPFECRWWDTESDLEGVALIFEEEFLVSFFRDSGFMERLSCFNVGGLDRGRLTLSEEEFMRVVRWLGEIGSEIRGINQRDGHILRAWLYQTLMQLNRWFVDRNGVTAIRTGNRYVSEFFRRVEWECTRFHTVQYYAGELCVTANYLNELVRRERGVTAKQVIQQALVGEAKRFLLYSGLSVSEISDRLSFESVSYFISFFRRHTGRTPSEFRGMDNREK